MTGERITASPRRNNGGGTASQPVLTAGASWYAATLLFRNNLRARRRRALVGYLWLVVPGIALTVAFSLLRHGALFVTGPVMLPYPVFALSGIFLWQCFTDGLGSPLQGLVRERHFLAVTAAPQGAIVVAGLLENLLALGVRMGLLLVVLLVFRVQANALWMLVPAAALIMLLSGFGVGLLVAPIGQLYDDVAALIGVVAAFGLFLLPVFYPVPAASPLAWNPLVAVIDAAHAWIAGAGAPHAPFAALVSCAILVPLGWWAIGFARPHVAARAV